MFRTSIACWALIFSMWGCQSTPGEPDPAADLEVVAQPATDTPEDLLQAAADASGARQARLYLQAAERFIEAGDPAAAAEALDRVDADRLRSQESARYLLARALVDLARGDVEAARSALLAVDPDALADPLPYALAQADLAMAEGDAVAAAESLMVLPSGDLTPEQVQQISDRIWHFQGEVAPFTALDREFRTTGAVRAWWQLKSAMFDSFTLAEQRRRLEAWRSSHAGHPAAQFPPAVLGGLDAAQANVTRVGLMLPLSGPLSRAGRAVRDAFIATYLTHRDDVEFEVVVYDTSAEPLGTLYERALVNGADVLIGPLAKESVATMNQLNPEIPVLALNYLTDEPPAANLLQLGLAIEDEATTLEQWLTDAGVQRLLVLHNSEEWATRASRTITSSWTGPLTVQALEDIRTVTESVGVAMHVAASETRHAALEELLGQQIEFLPRARGDVDAIVALVTPLEAGALVPALKFHFADRVPVYATSQTVRGATRDRLKDLEGFHVAELPWFTREPASFRNLDDAFGLDGSPFAALYALGVDAFRLAERVPLIVSGSFAELLGSTGELEFGADGRIQRRLARTVVRGGNLANVNASLGR